jgi:hypothetical protein
MTQSANRLKRQATRCICQCHSGILKSLDNSTIEWGAWTIAETLRRTIFLVNVINELSSMTKALNRHYYEPLDEAFVLDMPLPAPDSMWQAGGPSEWAVARDATNWTGEDILTLRTVLERLQGAHSPRLDGNDRENLPSVSRLIISCARHGETRKK